jgi:short-subunit dehydrogenase
MPRSTFHDVLTLGAAAALIGFAGSRLARARRRIALRNKTLLITGGSRGLGLLLAREAIAQGAKVAVCARNPDELHAARHEFKNKPFLALPCDVTRRPEVEQLVADVEQTFGPIDILINNAGTITVGPIELMTEDDYHEAMNLHFWAPLYTTLAVLPSMRERAFGRIVNISSIGGKIPVPHLAPYVASKFALTGWSETLRAEVAKDGILVTTVCPGLMRTGSPRNVGVKGRYDQEYAWFILGDSLPGMSMSARRAARKILDAAAHGDAEIILSLPANAAARLHGIAPELVSELMRLQNALLPKRPDRWDSGEGAKPLTGWETESWVGRSFLTALTQKAAQENNEVRGGGRPA